MAAIHKCAATSLPTLNVGNDRGMLVAVITQLLPFIGYPRTLNALAAINESLPRQAEEAQ